MNETMKICEMWNATKELDANNKVSYRLFKINIPSEIYLLHVSLGDENTAIVTGNSEAEAQKLAELFAVGGVTPCSANNIYADMINK